MQCRPPLLLALLLLAAWPELPAQAGDVVHVGPDRGGRIGAYIENYKRIRDAGDTVAIDGDCLSACTLLLGVLSPDKVCVTPRARLGFHKAWTPGLFGTEIENGPGTDIMWRMYPVRVRRWIAAHGGLTRRTLYLAGAELRRLLPPCPARTAAMPAPRPRRAAKR